jgi:hypothetical protein
MKKFLILIFVCLLFSSCSYSVTEIKPISGDEKVIYLQKGFLNNINLEKIKSIFSEYSYIGEVPNGDLILVK